MCETAQSDRVPRTAATPSDVRLRRGHRSWNGASPNRHLSQRHIAGGNTVATADEQRTNRDEGESGGVRLAQQSTVETLRGLAETARQGATAGADVSRQVTVGVAEQAEQVGRQLAEAAEIYRGVAQRMAEEARALMGSPAAAASGVQELSRVWAEWLTQAVQANAHFSQELLRARSLPEVAQIHARFVEEGLAGLREGGARVLEAAGGVVGQALSAANGDDEEDAGPVTVAEVMTRAVRLASPEETVQEAAAVMARADIGVLPVGEDDRIVGMLTDRDLAVRVVGAGKDPAKTKVRDAMTPGVEYCFEDEDVEAVAAKLAEQRLRRLPVLNREKRLVGVVSLGDLATDQPDPGIAGRALSGIAQEGGPHRQRPVRPQRAAAARQQPQRRR
jgi:CBS domain-containing protein